MDDIIDNEDYPLQYVLSLFNYMNTLSTDTITETLNE